MKEELRVSAAECQTGDLAKTPVVDGESSLPLSTQKPGDSGVGGPETCILSGDINGPEFRIWLATTGLSESLSWKPILDQDLKGECPTEQLLSNRFGGQEKLIPSFRDLFRTTHKYPPQLRFGAYEAIAHVGKGGSANVFFTQCTDPASAQADAPNFTASLLVANPTETTALLRENIEKIGKDMCLAVTKVFLPEHLATRAGIQRVDREMKMMALGKIPGTPPVLGGHIALAGDGVSYLHMLHQPGYDLQTILSTHGPRPLPVHLACDLGALAARNLTFLEQASAIHRDIKPGNLLITADGRMITLDLGLARNTEGHSQQVTQNYDILGTAEYLAPEVARGEQGVTPAADAFSLGVMLHQMFTGRIPFRGTALLQTVLIHREIKASTPIQLSEEDFPGIEDPRMRRFVRIKLMPLIKNLLQGDVDTRDSAHEAVKVLHSYSQFGPFGSQKISLEDFLNREYANIISFKLAEIPVKSRDPLRGYSTVQDMLTALQESSTPRSAQQDFLSAPELQPTNAPRSPKSWYVAATAGGVVVAVSALFAMIGKNRSPEHDPVSIPVVQPEVTPITPSTPLPAQTHNAPSAPVVLVKAEATAEHTPPAIELEHTDEAITALQLFGEKGIRIPENQLLQIYAESEKGKRVCGAYFLYTPDQIAQLLGHEDTRPLAGTPYATGRPGFVRFAMKNAAEGGEPKREDFLYIPPLMYLFQDAAGIRRLYTDNATLKERHKASTDVIRGWDDFYADGAQGHFSFDHFPLATEAGQIPNGLSGTTAQWVNNFNVGLTYTKGRTEELKKELELKEATLDPKVSDSK